MSTLTDSVDNVLMVAAIIASEATATAEEASDEDSDAPVITDFHPGTVDNPFMYNATEAQLEAFLLLNIFVAGKNASIQQKKADQFIDLVRRDVSESAVNELGVLSAIHNAVPAKELDAKIMAWLKEAKVGQYSRISSCIAHLSEKVGSGKLDLKKCKRENIVGVKGIGYKTASMFLMYTRKKWAGACLDTHILKFLKEEKGIKDAPTSTPSLKADYLKYEKLFLNVAEIEGKSPAKLDFEIWSKYRQQAPAPVVPAAI